MRARFYGFNKNIHVGVHNENFYSLNGKPRYKRNVNRKAAVFVREVILGNAFRLRSLLCFNVFNDVKYISSIHNELQKQQDNGRIVQPAITKPARINIRRPIPVEAHSIYVGNVDSSNGTVVSNYNTLPCQSFGD